MAKGWGWKLADLMLNLYSKGLLGGQPKEMMNLYEEALRGKVETGKAETTLGQKPIWTAGPDIPPGEGVAAGGIGATATGIMPPGREEGPTLAEAKALDLPGIFKTMIGAKTTMPFQAPVARKLMGPTALEQMGTEFPYLSGEDIKFRNFLQWKLLKATQKLEQPTKIPAEGEEEVEEREGVSYTPGVKDLTTALLKTLDPGFMETAFGYREKEKVPGVKTFGPEAGLYRGTEIIREPKLKPEKPRAGILGEYDEWQAIPENEGRTFVDFYTWRSNVSKDKAGQMTLQQVSAEYRQWLGLRKSIDDPTMVQSMLRAFGREPGEVPRTEEEIAALKAMIDDEIKYWRSELEARKARPGGRGDVFNLRREIESIRGRQ